MDIFDGVKVMLRWWFVVLFLSALTLAAAVSLSSGIQPEFRAEAAVLMVGPAVRESSTRPGEFDVLNPLIDQPSALETVSVVVSLTVQGPQAAGILEEEGLTTNFELGTERDAPIVLLETRADTREVALRSAQRLVEIIDEEVRLRQVAADVPADQRVTTSLIRLSSAGGADFEGRNRVRLLVVVLGIGMTVAVVFLLEGVRRRRELAKVQSEQRSTTGDDGQRAVAEPDFETDPEADDEDVVAALEEDVHAKRWS